MAAIANLTLTDAAATPVNHTYKPVQKTDARSVWENQASGIKIGMPVATMSITESAEMFRVHITLRLPILETLSGENSNGYVAVPKVGYEMAGKSEFILPKRSTLQDRKDVLALMKDFMGDAVVTAAVHDYERVW